ncbi:MAG: nuclear transport factor 2 family protein, partial [Rhodococcus sp. (in: high G+C Gram-positive bacteria)]
MSWTRTELEDAFAGYQNTVVECTRSGDWNAFADMFTEDVV